MPALKWLNDRLATTISMLLSGILHTFLPLWFLGSYDVTINTKKYILYPQGSLNGLENKHETFEPCQAFLQVRGQHGWRC